MDERRRTREAWADLSRRVRWLFTAWIRGFLVLVAAYLAAPSEKLADAVATGLFVAWSLSMISASVHLRRFRCPYCDRRFFGAFWGAPQRCQNCRVVRGRLPAPSSIGR